MVSDLDWGEGYMAQINSVGHHFRYANLQAKWKAPTVPLAGDTTPTLNTFTKQA